MNSKIELFLNGVNNALGRKTGFWIKRYYKTVGDARKDLFIRHKIDLVIDGGANAGQWAQRLIDDLARLPITRPQIISFEPGVDAFKRLVVAAEKHDSWICLNAALGDSEGEFTLFEASNMGQSSSLREPKNHVQEFETVSFRKGSQIKCLRLDGLPELKQGESIYLKLDLQGFEREALRGAMGIIERVKVLEVETAFSEMYHGQADHLEMLNVIASLGFRIIRYTEPAINLDGAMTYIDVLAAR